MPETVEFTQLKTTLETYVAEVRNAHWKTPAKGWLADQFQQWQPAPKDYIELQVWRLSRLWDVGESYKAFEASLMPWDGTAGASTTVELEQWARIGFGTFATASQTADNHPRIYPHRSLDAWEGEGERLLRVLGRMSPAAEPAGSNRLNRHEIAERLKVTYSHGCRLARGGTFGDEVNHTFAASEVEKYRPQVSKRRDQRSPKARGRRNANAFVKALG